ncbi:MAG: GlsB/YeaQ/YmgE family stress response membrane protein [Planctomycetota bacterium]|nr:MAG: GlsB/YeaQ/YmgE family stress response membrane protein [Planctomycetota bacterium]
MSLISFLIVGVVAGWLAGHLVKGGGFGLVTNLAVGVIGAIIGGYVFTLLGVTAGGLIGNIMMSTVGAVVLLVAVSAIKKS